MSSADIDALKATLNARTDQDLAKALGVERSAVAQWRRRGAVPGKYGFLLKQATADDIRLALRNAVRQHLFGNRSNHYWLRAALAVAPQEMFLRAQHEDADRGRELEARILSLVHIAINCTHTALQKTRCESEGDYDALVDAMKEGSGEAIALAALGPIESPQSGRAW